MFATIDDVEACGEALHSLHIGGLHHGEAAAVVYGVEAVRAKSGYAGVDVVCTLQYGAGDGEVLFSCLGIAESHYLGEFTLCLGSSESEREEYTLGSVGLFGCDHGFVASHTLSANTTMRRFIGYLYNPDTGGGISYLIDLDAPTNGVEDAENTPVAVWYQQEGRTLHILGDGMAETCIYNLDGTLVYTGSTSDGVLSLQSLPNGAYIARTSVEGKTVATTKVIIR